MAGRAVAVGFIHGAVQCCGALEVAGLLGRFKLRTQGGEFGVTLQHVAPRGLLCGSHFLGHVRESQVVYAFDIAAISLQRTQQHGEQAGFATAIGTDQGQLLPRLQCRVGTFEQQLAAAPQFDVA